jgi:hypothetical protein
MFQFGRLLTQTLVLGLGAGIPDINGVALTIVNFQYMTGTACSSAMVPVVGRCIGARQKEQAKMYSRKILSLNYFVLWAVVLLTVLFVEPLVGLYGLESGTPEAFTAMNLIVIHSLIASLIWPIGFMLPSAFRAASDVRSTFTKNGGNLATPGALQFNFTKQGQFVISADKTSEDALMDVVLDAGAEDILNNGDHFEILCPISSFMAVGEALEKAGIEPDEAELAWIPNSETDITDPEIAKKIIKLTDALEALDDVQNVYSNENIDDSLLD